MKAIHDEFGEVEVLSGPHDNEDGVPHFACRTQPVSWLRYYREESLTFPPHQEYWLMHYKQPQAPGFFRIKDSAFAELENNKWAEHISRHYQQDKDGPWQSETVHWKGKKGDE